MLFTLYLYNLKKTDAIFLTDETYRMPRVENINIVYLPSVYMLFSKYIYKYKKKTVSNFRY